ncbi:MAG: Smr/MutS family protein [Proteobacteria bacterium]|nr:Smr/MutS family protein [Pseudomonadota bacterium]
MSPSDDIDLWHRILKDITPLNQKKHIQKETFSKKVFFEEMRKRRTGETPLILNQPNLKVLHESKKYFEKKQIQLKIDLHGLTCEKANHALEKFFFNAQMQNIKTVLVITGKGKPKSEDFTIKETEFGILRTYVLDWITHHENFIVAYSNAEQKDGGSGAFYVHVRKL